MDRPVKLLDVHTFDKNYDDLVGKTLVFYDEHHGSARLLKDAQEEDIRRLDDEYTAIIVLEDK